MPFAVSPALSQCAPERNASVGVTAGADAIASSDLLPSSAKPGVATRPTHSTIARNKVSAIRITLFLSRPTGMGHGAIDGGADLLGVFPQITGREVGLARLPILLARGQFRIRKLDV